MADDLKRLIAARGQLKGAITRLLANKKTQEAEPDPADSERVEDIENKYDELCTYPHE